MKFKFDLVKICECQKMKTYNVLARFWAMPAILRCRYSPESRSVVLHCPLCILSDLGWLVDEFVAFKEILDNLNRSAAKDRPF